MKKTCFIFALLAVAACARVPAAPVTTTTSKVPVPPAPPRGEPLQFSGMGADKLRAQLGTPALVRKDGESEMWRYDGAACHAFFFLYGAAAAQVVRHVETLPRGTAAAADPACLNGLRKTS